MNLREEICANFVATLHDLGLSGEEELLTWIDVLKALEPTEHSAFDPEKFFVVRNAMLHAFDKAMRDLAALHPPE